MPSLKTVRPLLKLCLDSIEKSIRNNGFAADVTVPVYSFDMIALFENNKNDVNEPNSTWISSLTSVEEEMKKNPFFQLSTNLLEKIIRTLTKNSKHIRKTVLETLMGPQLENLRIRTYFDDYLKHFHKFGRLQSLSLKDTRAGDSCLPIIGSYCKCLKEFDIGGCNFITDNGIIALLKNSVDHSRRENMPMFLCNSLQILILERTRVTKIGCKMALQNCCSLRVLLHESTVEILAELAKNAVNQNLAILPAYSLTTLSVIFPPTPNRFTSNSKPHTAGSLELALSLCPMIDKVELMMQKGLTDTELLSLTPIKTFRELKLYKYLWTEEENQITFDGGVIPLLKVIGSSLKILDISCFNTFNPWAVIKLCPNLLSLSFNKNRDIDWRLQDERYDFQFEHGEQKRLILKELQYVNCGSNIPSEVLLCLLSSPKLVEIYMYRCNTLTDDVLRVATERHRFQHLERVTLRTCGLVTSQGIDTFLLDDNILKFLFVFNCKKVTMENIKELRRKSSEKNWGLKMMIGVIPQLPLP